MSDLPKGSLAILEIGCGSGQTLAAAKAEGKAAFTAGIEFDAAAAANAKDNADTVIQGDVETLELPFPDHHFDVVIKSEVLEHLVDPWAVLRKSRRLLKEDGLLYASSPNVAHISIIKQLLRNRFDYQQAGMTDWTHLRWFTPATYQEMIENAGSGFSGQGRLVLRR